MGLDDTQPKIELAARDTTLDGLVPEHLWVKISNCDADKKLRFSLELNGISREIFAITPSHADREEGIVLQSTNLTWILTSLRDQLASLKAENERLALNFIDKTVDSELYQIAKAAEKEAESLHDELAILERERDALKQQLDNQAKTIDELAPEKVLELRHHAQQLKSELDEAKKRIAGLEGKQLSYEALYKQYEKQAQQIKVLRRGIVRYRDEESFTDNMLYACLAEADALSKSEIATKGEV